MLLALAMLEGTPSAEALKGAGVTAASLNEAINTVRKGRVADNETAEESYEALKKYARDLTEAAATARSTRSSAATRKSAAPCRCCPAAPRTTRC
jgi:ATP-dependent Clp protease ATP-binding subunit ClpA